MDKLPELEQKKEKQLHNGQSEVIVKEEVSVTVKESHADDEKKYQEALKKYEKEVERVKIFGQELIELFHRSQETFEKQLSYISAGALALSIGFVKDIVNPIKNSTYKWMLLAGWILLIFTLLLNLVSHMLAGKYAKKGAKETEDPDNTYDPTKIDNRARRIEFINWITVGALAGGIILIVFYITLNAIL